MTTRLPADEVAPWRRLWWIALDIGECIARYVFCFGLGWLLLALMGPRGTDTSTLLQVSRWESFQDYVESGAICFLMIGVPSLLIVLVSGCMRKDMDSRKFRRITASVLAFFVWPLLFLNSGPILLGQLAIQLVFALLVMPVPLMRRASL